MRMSLSIVAAALLCQLGMSPARAEDQGDWKMVCQVYDMELADVGRGIASPADTSLASAGQAWLRHDDDYAILTMPDCKPRHIEMPTAANPVRLRYASTAGYLLGSRDEKASQTTWWAGGSALRPMRGPPDAISSGMPVLSTDGHWVAWIEAPPDDPRSRRVMIRSLDDDREQVVPLSTSEWWLLGLDMGQQELTLFENNIPNRYAGQVVIGVDGVRRGRPLVADGVEPQATSFLRVGAGWVAWDAVRDRASDTYQIAWAVAAGRGTHAISVGRAVTAVAVDPTGTYIAVSETGDRRDDTLNDVVYVIRASNGRKVWEKTLPPFARSSVAFLGDGLFVYTDVKRTYSVVRVLQIAD